MTIQRRTWCALGVSIILVDRETAQEMLFRWSVPSLQTSGIRSDEETVLRMINPESILRVDYGVLRLGTQYSYLRPGQGK